MYEKYIFCVHSFPLPLSAHSSSSVQKECRSAINKAVRPFSNLITLWNSTKWKKYMHIYIYIYGCTFISYLYSFLSFSALTGVSKYTTFSRGCLMSQTEVSCFETQTDVSWTWFSCTLSMIIVSVLRLCSIERLEFCVELTEPWFGFNFFSGGLWSDLFGIINAQGRVLIVHWRTFVKRHLRNCITIRTRITCP